MRLTLRTLLAWLDGVLPDAERDELGGKVAASPVAAKLVERISAAVESSGLPAPAGAEPPDDPNAVAEFLDNVLPAEQLEPFERACLESQEHLSEVAACHRLLAEAARDARLTGPPAGDERRRLIRAVAEAMSREPEQPAGSEPAAEAEGIPMPPEPFPDLKPTTKLAAGRERASAWAWLSAVAAIALLVVLGALLARTIWPPSRSPNQQQEEVAGVAPGPVAEPAGSDAHDAQQPQSAPPHTVVEPIEPDAESPPPVAALPTTPAPPLAPEDAVPLPVMEDTASASEESDGDGAAGALIPPAHPVADAALRADPATETEPSDSAPAGRVAAGDPILRIVTRDDAPGWQPAVAGDFLAANEEVLVPAFCYPVLERGDLKIRLQPGTRATIITDDDAAPRVEIVFGRGVVWTDAARPVAVAVSAAGLSGVATVGPRQPVGITVQLSHTPGDDPAVVASGQQAMVYATGGIEWRQTEADGSPLVEPLAGIAPTQPLPPAGSFVWMSSDPGAARLEAGGSPPEWLRQQAPVGRMDRGARDAVVRCLQDSNAEKPIIDALRALAADRRAENRMAAVITLALVGEYDDLISLLCEDAEPVALREAQWNRLVAETIPLALGRGVNSSLRLRQAFVARTPAGRGEEVFRLACGFPTTDLARGGGEALVAALEDPLLIIRRFALANLHRLMPDDREPSGNYRPDRSASLNEKGVAWWRRRVEALRDSAVQVP
jgi:hypothetical protein